MKNFIAILICIMLVISGIPAGATILGDVAEDGVLNLWDVQKLGRYIAGYKSVNRSFDENTLALADVNIDGEIKSSDLLELIKNFNGYTEENKDNPMPRFEFVSIMNKLCKNLGMAPAGFNDIDNDSPYYSEFSKAKAAGLISGDENGNATPEDTITRAEIAVIVSRAMRLDPTNADTSGLNENDVPVWAMPYIALMRDNGIMIGNGDGTFSAYDELTKEQGYIMAERLAGGKRILSDESCISVQDSGKWNEDRNRPAATAGKLEDFSADNVEVAPAMRSCSVKVNYVKEGVTFRLFYKKTSSSSNWKSTYDFTYVPSENTYYSSITLLGEAVEYDGAVYPYVDGVAYEPVTFTWTSQSKALYSEQYEPFFYSPEDVLIKPTFENTSYYVAYADPDWDGAEVDFETKAECIVYYKEKGESEFKSAVLNQYDAEHSQFRGSITELKEGTEYDFKAVINKNGVEEKVSVATFKTKTSDVPIAKIVKLKDIVKNRNGSLVLEHLSGTPDGYIKIVGDGQTVINGGERTGDTYSKSSYEAVLISDCHYLVLENFTVTGGGNNSVFIGNHSSEVHLVNFDISDWGRKGTLTANINGYEVLFVDEKGGSTDNDSGIYITDANDILIDRCYIHDPRGKANAWTGPKNGTENGLTWEHVHPKGVRGISINGRGNNVIRYCDIIGSDDHRWNDTITSNGNGDFYGGIGRDSDIYGNMLFGAQDDSVELDGGSMNIRLYKNRMEQSYTTISTAPTKAGPSYIFRNLLYNGGDEYFVSSPHFKQGGGSTHSHGRSFIINNTLETPGSGIKGVGYGDDTNRKHHFTTAYNNIVVVGKNTTAISADANVRLSDNVYDYNAIAVREDDGSYSPARSTIGGISFEMLHGSFGLPSYKNFKNGDFRLAFYDIVANDKGMIIPNMTDDFNGDAPDIGAFEYKNDDYFLPFRPIEMNADKYFIEGSGTVTVNTGSIEPTGYTVEILDAIKWLSVTPASGTFEADGKYFFSFTINKDKMTRGEEQTVALIRLKNGYSIPVTVKAVNPNLVKLVAK